MPTIRISHEARRGCGFRKPGGIYLVASELSAPCGRLPVPVDTCPCCGQGIKPARGFAWVDPRRLAADTQCRFELIGHGERAADCCTCPMAPGNLPERAGLLWVGSRFYPTATEFVQEAAHMGISRRLAAVPNGFKVGETLVLLGHRQVPVPSRAEPCPAVFAAFRPVAVEYVVKRTETDKELAALEERGFTLVDVVPIRDPEPQPELPLSGEEE